MNKTIYKPFLSLLLALLLALGCSMTAFAVKTDSDKIRLNNPDESSNTAFAVENMFPGDAETKYFTVKVNHKESITLYYHADIRPGYEKLAEVMMVKIELPKKSITLYDGLMRDMPSALEHQLAADEKEVIYSITAYLDTSVGNDYQFKRLIADFRWWYEEETSGGGEDPDPDKPSLPDVPDNPETGDNSNITLYMTMMLGSLAALIFLLFMMKRKKGEEAHE